MLFTARAKMYTYTIGTPDRRDSIDDVEKEAGAIFNRAAVPVRPAVRFVLKELIDEIPVRRMYLDTVKSSPLGVLSPLPKLFDHLGNLFDFQSPWNRMRPDWPQVAHRAGSGNGAGGNRGSTTQ